MMKPGILITIAAMALALVSIPDTDAEAKGWGWGHRNLRIGVIGSNFITSDTDGTPTPPSLVNTSLQSGIIKGGGSGIFSSQTTIEMAGMDSRCDDPLLPFGAPLATTVVLTFNDGSQLTLLTDEESYYCTDGSTFVVIFGGTVSGGTGRYGDAAGSMWEGTAEAFQSRVTGKIEVDLD
jgi:hypothetical protein